MEIAKQHKVIEQEEEHKRQNLQQCKQRGTRVNNLLGHQARVHKWRNKYEHPHQKVECALANKLLSYIKSLVRFHF